MLIRTLIVFALSLGVSQAADKDAWYARAVKSVEATIEPASAKPGQTVTFKLTVTLTEGHHTYPIKQPDPNAGNFVNGLKFPDPDVLIFVGEVTDPKEFTTKPEPALDIAELRTVSGVVVYERKAVVSPKASAGEAKVSLKEFKLNVCDATNCFPGKKLSPSASFTVQSGPAVTVEKEYAEAVQKALMDK